jgi:hypothetical protein
MQQKLLIWNILIDRRLVYGVVGDANDGRGDQGRDPVSVRRAEGCPREHEEANAEKWRDYEAGDVS